MTFRILLRAMDQNKEVLKGSFLPQDAGVAAVPGTVFGAEGYVRMSYCCSMEHLQEAMDRLERFLQLSQ